MTAPSAQRVARVALSDGEAVTVMSALQEYAADCRFQAQDNDDEHSVAWFLAKAAQADELYERVARA